MLKSKLLTGGGGAFVTSEAMLLTYIGQMMEAEIRHGQSRSLIYDPSIFLSCGE